MANSSDVSAAAAALATQYNNLRADVLNTSTGHTHDGTNAKAMSTNDQYGSAETRFLSLNGADCVPTNNNTSYVVNGAGGLFGNVGDTGDFYIPIHLPQGAIITALRAKWYRNDGSAIGLCSLWRANFEGVSQQMAAADSNLTTGYHEVLDDTITYPNITNTIQTYLLHIQLIPNDNVTDVSFEGAVITFTVVKPLP